jgi:hypothetical protein
MALLLPGALLQATNTTAPAIAITERVKIFLYMLVWIFGLGFTFFNQQPPAVFLKSGANIFSPRRGGNHISMWLVTNGKKAVGTAPEPAVMGKGAENCTLFVGKSRNVPVEE